MLLLVIFNTIRATIRRYHHIGKIYYYPQDGACGTINGRLCTLRHRNTHHFKLWKIAKNNRLQCHFRLRTPRSAVSCVKKRCGGREQNGAGGQDGPALSHQTGGLLRIGTITGVIGGKGNGCMNVERFGCVTMCEHC